MPINVTMPALSPTMTEGKLVSWLKEEGDAVASGDVLAEIETDKATMEVEAVDEGVLGRILVATGTEGVAVNTVIAMILEEGEDAKALEAGPVPKAEAKAAAKAADFAPGVSSASATPALAPAATQASSAPMTAPPQGGRVLASPLARRMAKDTGVDIASVRGTGPSGRIVQRDVDGAGPGARGPASSAAVVPVPEGAEAVPHSSARKIIASRLTEAWQTIPHIYLTVDCEVDSLLDVRKRLNERAGGKVKLSVNDFVVRAAAFALQKVPELNVQWSDAATIKLASVDVAVAVALDGGLVTPVVRNADQKGLAEISKEVRELAIRGKAGKLMPEEYQGGSFTISNLGMFGVHEFGAIINPPQAGILAVGAGAPRPMVQDGVLSTATVMTCTLSCDHRVVDGADGARWLQAFKGFVEEPTTMML
jgi:pyruvate dehydrogenase E2 component (dihydrolipoamide acetyltransferase)